MARTHTEGRRTAQGGEVDASTAEKANRAFVRAVGRIRKPPLTEDGQAVIARSMSERDLQASVEELARLLGWLVYHTYDSRRSAAGFPDLVMVRGDRLIFAELKSERGKVKYEQRVWHTALVDVAMAASWRPQGYLKRPHIRVFVFRPTDWLDGTIERVLRGEDA